MKMTSLTGFVGLTGFWAISEKLTAGMVVCCFAF